MEAVGIWNVKGVFCIITIREYGPFDLEELLALYAAVGWTSYTDRPDMLAEAYHHSLFILGAYDGETLVGVLRAVGDGASIVYIQDILVQPAYQRRGIGTQLMRQVMAQFDSVHQLVLMTDDEEKTKAFYRSLGLTDATETGCVAFMKVQ